ncbi:arylsulfatase [Crateriforma spongiae]|uniref:arylsulfatase n=1 Tax=Crateriforma spongiae TaxID=2724528 RepID=UPI0039AF9C64
MKGSAMSWRRFVWLVVATVQMVPLTCCGQVATDAKAGSVSTQRPNVILILADDFALGDLASNNGGASRTPNLDRLAAESVRFSNAYSGSCVCAPARAAMLTGRYPHRTGVVTLNQENYPKLSRLRLDETTLADVLRANGYATGLIGKWHCGIEPDYHPMKRGFDEFAGFIGPNSYFGFRLDVNEAVSHGNKGYLTEELTERAIHFVQRHHGDPFFLHLAHYAPHRPLEAPQELIDFYVDKGLEQSTATIYAMIEVMDQGIGKLLSELDRLDLSRRTLVIFASDNGPDPVTGTRFNLQHRGMKYEVYEGGIRVPLFFRWAGQWPSGERDQVVQFIDLFPTILDVCGVSHPPKLPIDGASLKGVLSGASDPLSRPLFWQWNRASPNYTHNAAMRMGNWKLVKPFVNRKSNPKDSDLKPLLFDLSAEEPEQRDVSEQHPERYAEMLKELNAWSRDVERSRKRKMFANGQ